MSKALSGAQPRNLFGFDLKKPGQALSRPSFIPSNRRDLMTAILRKILKRDSARSAPYPFSPHAGRKVMSHLPEVEWTVASLAPMLLMTNPSNLLGRQDQTHREVGTESYGSH
jgi:hypothetical protein